MNSGIHDKTALYLSITQTFNYLTIWGATEKNAQSNIPQLLNSFRKDTAKVTFRSTVWGFPLGIGEGILYFPKEIYTPNNSLCLSYSGVPKFWGVVFSTLITTWKLIYNTGLFCQAWWCTPVIPALWRLRQENHHKLKASLGYILRVCLKDK